jgi:nitrate/TMAO reductase-like tetraheme cytochrome c subunit
LYTCMRCGEAIPEYVVTVIIIENRVAVIGTCPDDRVCKERKPRVSRKIKRCKEHAARFYQGR